MEATALAHATSSRFNLLSSAKSSGTSTDTTAALVEDDQASPPRFMTKSHALTASTSWAPWTEVAALASRAMSQSFSLID
ncbi:hypothetical protein PR202_ga20137 [Eleusine coracana subsp. coracana]|uniref:Uncharacterized protein n=1 Tax=Eleusine coracana subsp. coracana TaxID=191504 RepID=A0AAV5CY94_ELECO|nr:hypothetical protein PR202_ga20137 [Eleusine coracana subsp. coracana]